MNQVHFSCQSREWETPKAFYDALHLEFGFTLDVAASASNAKCKNFLTENDDAFTKAWAPHVCWMNPPYGNRIKVCLPGCHKITCAKRGGHCTKEVPGIADWLAKAKQESLKGATVVALLPSRTDSWWLDYVWDEATQTPQEGVQVRFVRGRLKFEGAPNGAPFPSAVVVFS